LADALGRRRGATPPSGFTATTVAKGTFEDIEARNLAFFPEGSRQEHERQVWLSLQKTKGPSDLYVQSNVWAPGGTTGWHTHPGHSLIIVTAGAITAYDGTTPPARRRSTRQAWAFVDEGGDHAHVLRNEGTVEARTVAVQLIPEGAARRIDAEAPAACPL